MGSPMVNNNLPQQMYSQNNQHANCFAHGPVVHPFWRINALTTCPKQVRKQRLKATGNHEHKHVYENYPGLFSLDEELDAMAAKLDEERKAVRLWATTKIRSQMLGRAHALNLTIDGSRVNKYADISKAWEAVQSDANAKKMYEILFGDFEGSNAAWSLDWELEFLREHDREYVKEPSKEEDKKIGCYRAQISMIKIAQVKNINRNFSWKIQMSVPTVYTGKRTGRRKKGDFYLYNKNTVNIDRRGYGRRGIKKCHTNRCLRPLASSGPPTENSTEEVKCGCEYVIGP
jgi:hypothetical protein